jgi:hypothetical protein
MKNVASLFVFLFLVFTILEGVWAHEDHDMTPSNGSEEEIRYSTYIKPIFEKRCIKCHGADSPEHGEFKKDKKKYTAMMKGPKMDTYAHMVYFIGWPDTGALMRRLDDGKNTKDGKPGNMYWNLGDDEEERQKNLAIFKEWIGYWSLKRWSETTKEELDRIKAKY